MIKKLRHIIIDIPFHVLLFPLTITLTNFAQNQSRLPLSELAPVSLGFTLVIGLTAYGINRLVKSWAKSALITTIITFYIFYFPTVANALTESITTEIMVLSAGGMVCVLICGLTLKSKQPASHLVVVPNLLFILFVIPPALNIISYQIAKWPHRPDAATVFPDIESAAATDGPDIWHLVFDRYASLETLDRVYNFDNKPFLSTLEDKGFSVAPGAAANYQRTAHSLASTLNMDYLGALTTHAGKISSDWMPVYEALHNHRMGRLFTQWGYSFHHFGSWWNPTRYNRLASDNHNFRDMPESLRALIFQSLFGRLGSMDIISWPYVNGRNDQCKRIHFQFDTLRELADKNEKKYVFAHILLPHPPFVVDAKGACKSLAQSVATSRTKNYTDQLVYANNQILQLIEHIRKGKRPAIIILQSDEGPWPKRYAGNEHLIGRDVTGVKWKNASRRSLREKTQILYAISGPNLPKNWLQPNETPINLYRRLLNNYYGLNLPMLPEKSFTFYDNKRLYRFLDVTKQVR